VLRAGVAAAAGGAAARLLASCSVLTSIDSGGSNNSIEGSAGRILRSTAPLPEPFTVALPIPPVLRPARVDADTDYYEIDQRVGRARIIPGLDTEVWGYEGIFPGPTIMSRSGRRTVVTHRNHLPVPVAVHLHGGRTAPEHDGYPTEVILPADHVAGAGHGGHAPPADAAANVSRGSRDYVYEMQQPAATLWYHDHRMDFTGPQVYRGLAGFHLIGSDEEDALGLPSGDRDIPMMIVDRAFAADGSFDYPATDSSMTTPGVTDEYMSGVLGDCILVNGAPWPVLEVAAARYRFRLLNASNARRYRLRLEGGNGFVQIGSDGGLLESPLRHEAIDIAQAERFDVVVDFSGRRVGEEITLVNDFGAGGTARVMRFVVTSEASADDSSVPDRLAVVERLRESDVQVEREFVFARGGAQAHGHQLWTINGQPFSPDSIQARPALGTVERWRIRAQNVEHPFHIHLAPFQVIGSGGNLDPGPYNSGWKDTVNLDNGGQVDLLIRFDGYRGRYVLHCHNLEHEDMMMMANFEVV
jgi:spore coat protein A